MIADLNLCLIDELRRALRFIAGGSQGGVGLGVCEEWEHWCRAGSSGLWLKAVARGPYAMGLYKGAAAGTRARKGGKSFDWFSFSERCKCVLEEACVFAWFF